MADTFQLSNAMKNLQKETDRALRRFFSGKIKGTFLLEMKYNILRMLGNEIHKYYTLQISDKMMASMDLDLPDFDICCHIVGLHRSNLIFVSESERLEKEKSEEYKLSLTKAVIENVKLRNYGSIYFRRQSIIHGDNFIYFHVPYDLFIISVKMCELLSTYRNPNLMCVFFSAIAKKSIATLTLLEDGFLDSAYPLCRGIIELYIKMLVLMHCPDACDYYSDFSSFELNKSCINQEYSQDFNDLFNKRRNKNFRNKSDFLHYGWVDCIDDYHLVQLRPYTISGLISYLKTKYNAEQVKCFDDLETLYKMCHGYTHGNTYFSKYPLLNYFEISTMLYYTVSHSYRILCELMKVSNAINGVNIADRLDKDFSQLALQYSKRSTENFELYYKT